MNIMHYCIDVKKKNDRWVEDISDNIPNLQTAKKLALKYYFEGYQMIDVWVISNGVRKMFEICIL